jgi:hypothetical protein
VGNTPSRAPWLPTYPQFVAVLRDLLQLRLHRQRRLLVKVGVAAESDEAANGQKHTNRE